MRHQPGCHGTECPVCGEMFTNSNTLKKHKDEEHKMEVVMSKEICYHWRRGHCFKGDECKFSHAVHQNSKEHHGAVQGSGQGLFQSRLCPPLISRGVRA